MKDLQETIATHAYESESEECIKKESQICGEALKTKLMALPQA